MPKSLQLQIPTPCHENWQNMTPHEQGRHCMACQKTVVDFTIMSDREILNHISKSSNNICGRIANDQLERPIPFPTSGPRGPRKYFWRVFIPAFLLAGKANARQGNIKINTVKIEPSKTSFNAVTLDTTRFVTLGFTVTSEHNENNILDIIRGHIFDSVTNEPLDGVSVKIVGAQTGTVASNGKFELKHTKGKKNVTLDLSCVGYKKTSWVLNKNADWSNLRIQMVPEPQILAPVTVRAQHITMGTVEEKLDSTINSDSSITSRLGGLIRCYRITRAEKLMRSLADTLSIPAFRSVKVYPNPVVRGNSMNIELSLKETGDYKLEILDVSGRVVFVHALPVNEKKQTSQIPTSSAWSSGIYWLRITGQHTKSIYQSKILLQ